MDVPDVPKLLDILEQQRGALLMRSSHGLDTPSKKKGNPAAAAAAVGKPGTPSKFKKKQSCPSDGCNGEHFLFKCSKSANLTMVTQSIAKKLQLPSTGRVATISMADGKVQSCPTVKLCLVDRNKNKHVMEAAVVHTIGHTDGLRSMDPAAAAALFDMKPQDFSLVNGPLDILLGHVMPSGG